ncbi:hypothetical protein RYF45_13860, partial [Pseudomonas syringae pv. actinidiae]|nr:hypothetical protein [Pseudomonas syringae pv. actinidiae]
GHIRAKSGLSEAIEGLDAEKNKAAYRVLGSTPFCLAVLMLEVWNVSSEVSAWEQTVREKGVVRTGVGILGASLAGHIRAKSGLSEAIEGLDAEKNKAAYRVLGSTPFCLAVLMLEVWNVSSEVSAWEHSNREKSFLRASAGVLVCCFRNNLPMTCNLSS